MFFVWWLIRELLKKHQYRHFQGRHDRIKVWKSERYKINGKHFHPKNEWPGCASWLQIKLLVDLIFELVEFKQHWSLSLILLMKPVDSVIYKNRTACAISTTAGRASDKTLTEGVPYKWTYLLTAIYMFRMLCFCTVLLVVGFSALVATLWCIGACRCQRGRLRSRSDSPWKQVPSDNFQLRNDGSKPLLVGDEEEDDAA